MLIFERSLRGLALTDHGLCMLTKELCLASQILTLLLQGRDPPSTPPKGPPLPPPSAPRKRRADTGPGPVTPPSYDDEDEVEGPQPSQAQASDGGDSPPRPRRPPVPDPGLESDSKDEEQEEEDDEDENQATQDTPDGLGATAPPGPRPQRQGREEVAESNAKRQLIQLLLKWEEDLHSLNQDLQGWKG